MARHLIKSDMTIRNPKPTDATLRMNDGEGLYLLIKPNGARWWRLDYSIGGKRKTLSIGVYPDTGLKAARDKADEARQLVAAGIDPSNVRKADKAAAEKAAEVDQRLADGLPAVDSFEAVAVEWLLKKKTGWAASQYTKIKSRLDSDVLPWLGNKPIASIKAMEVLAVLRRIEERGAINSAHQARTTIGQVLRYGVATGWLEHVVTDGLKGALEKFVSKHRAAITDPKQLGELLRAANGYTGWLVVKSAVILTVHTFLRQGELRSAEWCDIDLDAGLWNVPAEKMKMKEPHIVPLSRQAVEILAELRHLTGHGRYVFPSIRRGDSIMSENTVSMALRAMGYSKEQVNPHGFRATARTLLDEVLGYRIELIEMQLAHAVKDVHGRAYNRTTFLAQRKEMMQEWADYLDKLAAGATILPFKTA